MQISEIIIKRAFPCLPRRLTRSEKLKSFTLWRLLLQFFSKLFSNVFFVGDNFKNLKKCRLENFDVLLSRKVKRNKRWNSMWLAETNSSHLWLADSF